MDQARLKTARAVLLTALLLLIGTLCGCYYNTGPQGTVFHADTHAGPIHYECPRR